MSLVHAADETIFRFRNFTIYIKHNAHVRVLRVRCRSLLFNIIFSLFGSSVRETRLAFLHHQKLDILLQVLHLKYIKS